MITAKNIIMAPGAEPKSLHFSEIKEIPLSTALDPDRLNKAYDKEDTVAIFGSSHSAMLAIQNLIEAGKAKRIINFFLEPLRYAVYFDDWILFDDTGLKGNAAIWARENIDGQWPEKLSRILSTQENIHLHLPSCNKVIYATGFQRRSIPIDGMQNPLYNEQNGIIAPGLFGLGIAFPEARVDRYGTLEYRVGLWKFVDYLSRVLPLWIKYPT